MKHDSTFFAPQLFLKNVSAGMEFYKKAFNATELRRWSNDDGRRWPKQLRPEAQKQTP